MSNSGSLPGIVLARTVLAGIALQNGTPTFLTGTVPNDGQLHPFYVVMMKVVTGIETGGQVQVQWTLGGAGKAIGNDPGGRPVGQFVDSLSSVADPGATITCVQGTALTAGASVVYGALVLLG